MDLKEANKIIGNTYKQIRKSKKFTQEEVAEKSDLTPEYLSKFENGKYNASIYNIILYYFVKLLILIQHNYLTNFLMTIQQLLLQL